MSTAMKSGASAARAATAEPMTPPVGPDPSNVTARLATYSGGITPPVACMISTCPAYPAARSCSTRCDV